MPTINTPEQRSSYIGDIEQLPDLMEAAVAGLNDAQLDTSYREGGWTVRQVVHHVVDSHFNAMARMKLALTEEHPTIKPYDQDAWATLADYALPVEPSLAMLRGLHMHITVLLQSVAGEHTWQRAVYHPENGDMTLDDFVRTYANHGKNHVEQITGLRARNNW